MKKTRMKLTDSRRCDNKNQESSQGHLAVAHRTFRTGGQFMCLTADDGSEGRLDARSATQFRPAGRRGCACFAPPSMPELFFAVTGWKCCARYRRRTRAHRRMKIWFVPARPRPRPWTRPSPSGDLLRYEGCCPEDFGSDEAAGAQSFRRRFTSSPCWRESTVSSPAADHPGSPPCPLAR